MSNPFKKLGSTGKYPRGKLSPDDDGEIQMAIATDHVQQVIKINFGTPIKWLGLDSTQARELARLMNEKADELDKKRI